MRRPYTIILLVVFIVAAHSQNAIGISGDQYHLYGPNSSWGQYLQVGGNGTNSGVNAQIFTTNGNLHIESKATFRTYINYYNKSYTILNGAGGNVGIGVQTPSAQLHLYMEQGDGFYPAIADRGDIQLFLQAHNNGIEIGNSRGFNARRAWILARHSDTTNYGKYYSTLHLQPDIGDKSQYRGIAIGYSADETIPVQTHLAVNGKVGIGTLNPDELLTVNGIIHAKEIIVDTAIADYVFNPDYQVKTIDEVKSFISQNGHLPDVPNEKQVSAEGVSLGDMNRILLQKIEELTLYVIAQEKRILELEAIIKVENK